MSVDCRDCSAKVIWLPLYNGHTRPFDPTVYTAGTHDVAERWYIRRDPLMAVPEDIAGSSVPPGSDYLIEHRCTGRRQGVWTVGGEENPSNTPLDRARREGPFVRDHPLQGTRFVYTYRWPSSWAHIVERGYTAICGARMHGEIRTKPRERSHLKDMPVCPDCARRYAPWLTFIQMGGQVT
jgi:hypothetical protein